MFDKAESPTDQIRCTDIFNFFYIEKERLMRVRKDNEGRILKRSLIGDISFFLTTRNERD